MAVRSGKEIRLVAHARARPTAEHFVVAKSDVEPPVPGQVLVRNLYMSVDPYMRNRMTDAPSYLPPFAVGEPLDGGAIGEVIASASPNFAAGDLVSHGYGWRELALVGDTAVRRIDPGLVPGLSAHLGPLGVPGLTAYVGLLDIAGMRPGDTVYVSSAAGGVGSLAGQIARLRGATRVIGSAGSPEKAAYLVERLRFDVGLDYRARPIRLQLPAAAPEGIDVYFDNVGGDHLDAALRVLRPFGRVAMCGSMAHDGTAAPTPGPYAMPVIVGKRLRLEGFLVTDHEKRWPEFLATMGTWIRQGEIRYPETIVDGIDAAVDAFLDMLDGNKIGKMLVRLAR